MSDIEAGYIKSRVAAFYLSQLPSRSASARQCGSPRTRNRALELFGPVIFRRYQQSNAAA